MKKTTKVTKTLTPAPKTTKTVRKTKSVVPAAAAQVVPTAVVTKISANIDVGFGNALFLRGEGAGLNWNKGLRMECVGSDLWELTLGHSSRPFVFKFLINDEVWSTADDYTVAPGTSTTFTPSF